MEITWVGKSCFFIKTSMGKRILIDPFKCNYVDSLNNISYITLSHNHFNNDYMPENLKESTIIQNSQGLSCKDLSIDCIESFHDEYEGKKRGVNRIFIFNFDNFRIAHLGHLGHILDKDSLKILENINILCIPIGGNFTIDAHHASTICNQINANIVLPMNYNLNTNLSMIDGVDKFIPYMSNIKKVDSPTIIVNDFISYKNQVLLLTPSAYL